MPLVETEWVLNHDTLVIIFGSPGLAAAEGGGGDDQAPVFFTNTSGNMFLQPPAGSTITSEGQVTGNFATLDSDMGAYGVQGAAANAAGQLQQKSNEVKKVRDQVAKNIATRPTPYSRVRLLRP